MKHEEGLARNKDKLEGMLKYNEVVKERDALRAEVEEMATKVEANQHVIDKQKTILAQKERELTKRVQSVKDSEWMKVATLQEKNSELEAKAQDFETLRTEMMTRESDGKVRLQEQIGAIEREKMELEKQLSILNSKLEWKEDLEKELEREKNEHAMMKKKLMTAQNELLSFQNVESEMMTDMQRLRSTNESLKQQNAVLKQELETVLERTSAEKSHKDSQWTQEKLRLNERNQYLEDQVEKLHGKLKKAGQVHVRKKRSYEMKLAKLQEKSDILEAKEFELNVEKQQMDESVPLSTYNDVKQKLTRAERRYKDLSDVKSVDEKPRVGTASLRSKRAPRLETEHVSEAAVTKPALFTEKNDFEGIEKGHMDESKYSNADKMYMKELESLKERLRRLSAVQREQMKYFLGNEEAADMGRILDTKEDFDIMETGNNAKLLGDQTFPNSTSQFEISDLELTLT